MAFLVIGLLFFQPSLTDISKYQIEISVAFLISLIIVFGMLGWSFLSSKVIGKTVKNIYEKLAPRNFIVLFDSYRYADPIYIISVIILSAVIMTNSNVTENQLDRRYELFVILLWIHCIGIVAIHSNKHTTLFFDNKKNWYLAKANFKLAKTNEKENRKSLYFSKTLSEFDNFCGKNFGFQIKIKDLIINDFIQNIESNEIRQKYQSIFDCENIHSLRMQLQKMFPEKDEYFTTYQSQLNYQKISVVIALSLFGIVGSRFLIDFI